MKRKIFIGLSIALCLQCAAQENQVKRLPDVPKRTAYKDYSAQETGYWFAVEPQVGTMADAGRRCIQFCGADYVNGWRFSEFLRAGVGIGMKYYINSSDVRTSSLSWAFPLYADVRGNIISQNNRNTVPFWSADIGAEIHNGFFFAPAIGLRMGEQRCAFTVSLSYCLMQMDTWSDDGELRNLVSLKLGYEF